MNSEAASLLPSSTIMTSKLGAFFCSAKDRRHRSSGTQSLKTAMMTLKARPVAVSCLPIGALCCRGAALRPVGLHKQPRNHNLTIGVAFSESPWPGAVTAYQTSETSSRAQTTRNQLRRMQCDYQNSTG